MYHFSMLSRLCSVTLKPLPSLCRCWYCRDAEGLLHVPTLISLTYLLIYLFYLPLSTCIYIPATRYGRKAKKRRAGRSDNATMDGLRHQGIRMTLSRCTGSQTVRRIGRRGGRQAGGRATKRPQPSSSDLAFVGGIPPNLDGTLG